MKMWRTYGRSILPYLIGILITTAALLANATHGFPGVLDSYSVINGFGIEQSVFALLVGAAISRVMRRGAIEALSARSRRVLMVVSVLFGILNVCGANMAYLDSFMFSHGLFWGAVFLYCVCGYAAAFYFAAVILFGLLETLGGDFDDGRPGANQRLFLWSFVIILGVWLIWIVAFYPATVDYDSERQLFTYLGVWPKSNHDPWFATCVLGFLFSLGRSIANDNFGMFLYIIFRAVVMALIYARCITLLAKCGVKKAVYGAVLAFYSFTPVWGAYSKQPFKDTFAAALFCWFVIRGIILVKELRESGRLSVKTCLLFSLAGLIVSLFRHNYFYVYAVSCVMLLLTLWKRRCLTTGAACILVGVAVYLGFNSFITNYVGVAPGKLGEALSIPFQQTARCVKEHANTLTEEEKRSIERLFDIAVIGESYDPVISDPVKDTVREAADVHDYVAYFGAWAQLLVKHPVTYAEATIGGTYGYYAFTHDGYPAGGKGNCGMVIIDGVNYDSNAGFDTYFDFFNLDAFGALRSMLNSFHQWWHRIPILSLTDTIPAYTWFIVMMCFYVLLKGQRLEAIPFLMVAVALLTCIASPVNGSFRYFAPIAAATPALLACCVGGRGISCREG